MSKMMREQRMARKPWITFTQFWPSAHTGRFFKRRLSKLRRRYWDLDKGHTRGLYGAMSTVNYKTW